MLVKMNRLLAILTLLSERNRVTMPELAEKLEVSRRTIHRDIEELCQAGIPIGSKSGRDGGIYLMEGYHWDSRLFRKEELSEILAGVQGIESIKKKGGFLKERISEGEDFTRRRRTFH